MTCASTPFVSIVMPALNEENFIADAIRSVLPEGADFNWELLVLDGGSTDATRDIVRAFSAADARIRLIANRKRLQAAAMNTAARMADPRSGMLVRADCHAIYPPGFVAGCLRTLLETGAASVVVPLRSEGRTCLQHAIAFAQNSRMGNGGSAHRTGGRSGYVDHGHHAAFDRRVFLDLGGYDETFSHNEDAEYDARLTRAGHRIYLDANLTIGYFPRNTLGSLARQYRNYGRGRARMLRKHSITLKPRQMLPVAALIGSAGALPLALADPRAMLFPLSYVMACLLWGGALSVLHWRRCLAFSGMAALVMHMSWAFGFLSAIAMRKRVRHGASAVLALLFAAISALQPALADEPASPPVRYELGPQDKLRIRVFEWRASIDQVYTWEALNEKYVVGPSGQLAVPLIGEVSVTGLTTAELAGVIAERLRARMGLAAAPDAAVEVIEYRPFFVAGHVEKPGEYPYRPGMTVLQAVSIGGGLLRPRDVATLRLQRDAITARGELAVTMAERDRLHIRAARLQAELDDRQDIALPATLRARRNSPDIAAMMEQEQLIHQSRRRAFETQMRTLKELRSFLDQEVASLRAQRKTHDTQLALVKDELSKVRGLAGRGLTTSARHLELERLMTQLEGDGLKLDGSLIKTRQEISRTDLSMIELENKRSGEVAVELQKTRDEIAAAERKAQTSAKLIYEAEIIAPELIAQDEGRAAVAPTYRLIRRVAGEVAEMPADETTLVLPGDTVKVELDTLRRARLRLEEPPPATGSSHDDAEASRRRVQPTRSPPPG